MGASVLPIRFELRQIAGGREGSLDGRGRNAEVQAGLCQQSRQSTEADCPEREADVSLVSCLKAPHTPSCFVFSLLLPPVCLGTVGDSIF